MKSNLTELVIKTEPMIKNKINLLIREISILLFFELKFIIQHISFIPFQHESSFKNSFFRDSERFLALYVNHFIELKECFKIKQKCSVSRFSKKNVSKVSEFEWLLKFKFEFRK